MLTCYKAALSVTEAPVPEIKIDYDIGGCKMKKDHRLICSETPAEDGPTKLGIASRKVPAQSRNVGGNGTSQSNLVLMYADWHTHARSME